MKTNFYIDNSQVNPPQNWQELELQLNFDRDKTAAKTVVSINDWTLVRENNDYVQQWINDGLSGGVGLFEAIPFKIEIERGGVIEKPFDGYLDLTDENIFSDCIKSTIKAKEADSIDWLNDVADGFTFEYLYKEVGTISKADYVYQPYILNSVPDYLQSAITLLSTYVIKREIETVIKDLTALSVEVANPFEATAIVRVVLLIAYLALLIISLLELIKQTILLLIQPTKYHTCMYAKTLLEKGAEYLGLTFQSEIFNTEPFQRMVIIPEKNFLPNTDNDFGIFGFTDPEIDERGYFNGTYGDLLRAMKQMFKAKVVINNKIVYLVREDINVTPPIYQLPDLYQPYYSTNANEFNGNYFLTFSTDVTDKNTIQEYEGTSYQVIASPVTIKNQNMVLLKGLQEVRIPFALAKTKTDLTIPEIIVDAFATVFSILINVVIVVINVLIEVANIVISIVNGVIDALDFIGIDLDIEIQPINNISFVDLGALIDNRIGMLKIELDSFQQPKVFILQKGGESFTNKIDQLNSTYLNADYLYNNFHFIQSWLPSVARPNANQYIIKEYENVPFCFNDYQKIKNNNRIFTAQNEEAEINSLKWNPYHQKASISVRINKLLTTNLKETYVKAT